MIQFTVNVFPQSTDAPADTPLLWVLREGLKLTGTKFGCGAGLCGAYMVHIDGARLLLPNPNRRGGGPQGHDDRGVIDRFHASRAEGVGGRARATVRLLSVRPDHERGRPSPAKASSHPKRNRRAHAHEYLPLRDLSTDRWGYRARGAGRV